jgi:hypothetical protein
MTEQQTSQQQRTRQLSSADPPKGVIDSGRCSTEVVSLRGKTSEVVDNREASLVFPSSAAQVTSDTRLRFSLFESIFGVGERH